MKGGARKGAGRKSGSTKKPVTVKLEGSTISLLHDRVPKGKRASFIEEALRRALDQLPAAESQSPASH